MLPPPATNPTPRQQTIESDAESRFHDVAPFCSWAQLYNAGSANNGRTRKTRSNPRPIKTISARMTNPFLIPGILHSPYFIFVRCAGKYSDVDLLHRFGLPKYTRTRKVPG